MKISKVSSKTSRPAVSYRYPLVVLLSLWMAVVSPVFANSVSLAGDITLSELRWKSGTIRISISASLLRESPNIKHDSDVPGAIKRSIEAWSRVADIDILQTATDKLSASPAGPAGDGTSLITIAPTPENVLLFAKDPEGAAATTRVFYNRHGQITEADIVLNPYQQFSTDGTLGTFDLESTLTHEIGHLLGLPHSEVLGSTMHANYGKNGVLGLQRFLSRTLSEADIAAVRAIYGARGADSECCGTIDGRLSIPGKQSRTIVVWIEDEAGRVHGSARATSTGDFGFSGLNEGKYRLFALEPSRAKNALPAQEIGTVIITPGETATVSAKTVPGTGDFELNYLGANGQLSEMAISLSPGRSHTVYLGGRNLDPKHLSISFSSTDIFVVPGTIRSLDYGDEISVVAFEVRVSPRAANGEYSIFAESRNGYRRAVIGGLAVDNFAYPWASFIAFDE